LEDLPEPATPTKIETVVAEPEVVLTQELIPETTITATVAVPAVVEGEKRERKKRKKVSDVNAPVAVVEPPVPSPVQQQPVQKPVPSPVQQQPAQVKLPETQPQTQPATIATEQVIASTTTTGEPEKKKKKKKKVAVDTSDAVSQASSTPAAGLLSTQPIHIQ
jgi:hypothetical protein